MMQDGPLICAFRLDGKGGGIPLSWSDLDQPAPDEGFVWIHLQRKSLEAQEWLRAKSDLDAIVVDALLAEESRPRCMDYEGGLLLNLRGANLNPGSAPEDMLSIRVWVTQNRIISTRHLKLMAVDDIRQAITKGAGPRTPGLFISVLADRLVARMWPVISEFDEAIDTLEDAVIVEGSSHLRGELANVRRQAIVMRRYIAPQRDALSRLSMLDLPFTTLRERNRLREVYENVTRYVENLDELRERAAIIQDELTTRLTNLMNRNLYVLSVAAAIFLPLNLLAGMMGMNVGGMPGLEIPWAFTVVALILLVLGVLEYWLLRWMKWI